MIRQSQIIIGAKVQNLPAINEDASTHRAFDGTNAGKKSLFTQGVEFFRNPCRFCIRLVVHKITLSDSFFFFEVVIVMAGID